MKNDVIIALLIYILIVTTMLTISSFINNYLLHNSSHHHTLDICVSKKPNSSITDITVHNLDTNMIDEITI